MQIRDSRPNILLNQRGPFLYLELFKQILYTGNDVKAWQIVRQFDFVLFTSLDVSSSLTPDISKCRILMHILINKPYLVVLCCYWFISFIRKMNSNNADQTKKPTCTCTCMTQQLWILFHYFENQLSFYFLFCDQCYYLLHLFIQYKHLLLGFT